MSLKCSIILSTYNGEKFIVPLLDSLRCQIIAPYEVIIIDDCSTDNTVEIVKRYIDSYKLYNWLLEKNTKNVGWKENFKRLIYKASGELIFPCDQDDVWEKDKLKKMREPFIKNPCILLLCSDYNMIYMDKSHKFPSTKISHISNSGEIEKINSRKALLTVDRPGCTYCINRKLICIMKEIDFYGCPHDALAWRSAYIGDGLYVLHKKLIKFRRHSNNASDDAKRLPTSRKEVASYFINYLGIIYDYINKNKPYDDKEFIFKCILTQEKRKNILDKRSILRALCMIKYLPYYPSFNTYAMDVLSIVFNR